MSQGTFELFPVPSNTLVKSLFPTPRIWPGASPAAIPRLLWILEDNHIQHQIFTNSLRFHNHTAHAALARWSLGADETILDASYQRTASITLPLFRSPQTISRDNWKDHLADTQFLDGLMHPMIHVGHGLEFGLPGTIAEGLAMAAGHYALSTQLIPASLFSHSAEELESDIAAQAHPLAKKVDAFTVFGRITGDSRFETPFGVEPPRLYASLMKRHGTLVKEYVDQWNLEGNIVDKIEELIWITVTIYGVGGYSSDAGFIPDFFFMHFVTSVIFLPFILAHLKPQSQLLLLRSYFSVCIGYTEAANPPPHPLPRIRCDSSDSSPPPQTNGHNSWSSILGASMTHSDDHLPKLQRTLNHCSELFGDRKAGYFSRSELKGTELLDGTLFLRVAEVTATRMESLTENEPPWNKSWKL
ncbi:hypothetical protein K443DRAFT_125600 [Laccaria amethystina LaAM-08-1]|uniref:Uncharacterized protein n=1 Tax=Laccaria amethystina LaAM-08-1 TaxID=1095629 RepID=A0A0C9WQJ3_9AGAR|nr:hypothetical protein K443DRAFT_125600 [Laccaria amethystina LaAM-08-1]